jgi:RNA polymerase sigma-70 factor (ECF subfamily)
MAPSQQNPGRSGQFASTHWSLVLRAADSQATQSPEALEKFCAAYWYPLYVYIRCRGYNPEEAGDLTREFFSRLLQKKCCGWPIRAGAGCGLFC